MATGPFFRDLSAPPGGVSGTPRGEEKEEEETRGLDEVIPIGQMMGQRLKAGSQRKGWGN